MLAVWKGWLKRSLAQIMESGGYPGRCTSRCRACSSWKERRIVRGFRYRSIADEAGLLKADWRRLTRTAGPSRTRSAPIWAGAVPSCIIETRWLSYEIPRAGRSGWPSWKRRAGTERGVSCAAMCVRWERCWARCCASRPAMRRLRKLRRCARAPSAVTTPRPAAVPMRQNRTRPRGREVPRQSGGTIADQRVFGAQIPRTPCSIAAFTRDSSRPWGKCIPDSP